ncbi:hypothetical protein LTR16_009083, partial [Cryomyces antarcticus]
DGDPSPTSSSSSKPAGTKADAAGLGIGLYALILIGGALAFGAYKYLQMGSAEKQAL